MVPRAALLKAGRLGVRRDMCRLRSWLPKSVPARRCQDKGLLPSSPLGHPSTCCGSDPQTLLQAGGARSGSSLCSWTYSQGGGCRETQAEENPRARTQGVCMVVMFTTMMGKKRVVNAARGQVQFSAGPEGLTSAGTEGGEVFV